MTTAIVVAGTGKVSTKAALALLKDHIATLPDEDDFDLVLPLPRETSHVNYSLLDYVDEFPNVTLFAPVGTVVDEEVLEHVDSATFIDNPTGHAFDLLEEGDVVLLAFDSDTEEKEAESIKALKLAQSKGATVLDLTDGLLELRWEDEPEEEEAAPTDVEEAVEEEEPVVEPEPEPEPVVEKPKRTRKPKTEPVVEPEPEQTFVSSIAVGETTSVTVVPWTTKDLAPYLTALDAIIDEIANRVAERLSK